jgi:hypothetical protein
VPIILKGAIASQTSGVARAQNPNDLLINQDGGISRCTRMHAWHGAHLDQIQLFEKEYCSLQALQMAHMNSLREYSNPESARPPKSLPFFRMHIFTPTHATKFWLELAASKQHAWK